MNLTSLLIAVALIIFPCGIFAGEKSAEQLLIINCKFNTSPRGYPQPVSTEKFLEIKKTLPDVAGGKIRLGIGFIFSYLRTDSDEQLLDSLRTVLRGSEETDTPILLQFDGEQWWDSRPDLWNWWDSALPGYNPDNRKNVEWTSWSEKDAMKIAWRNWGHQLRVRPPPNLMSPRYRKVCHEKMELVIPVVLNWWKKLPAEKKELLVGIKVGWESSIGVNAWYYPNGNDLMDKPASEDPTTGLDGKNIPSRGVTQIGYAAVKTAGIRKKGDITEADLAEVTRRHLEDLSRKASRLGVPREKLFTHSAGWKDDELNYQSAVNKYSCPGWSFYQHASDPSKDTGVQKALQRSDAPFWAATEWLLHNPSEEKWRAALNNALADRRCRYLCIYNWEGIRQNEGALEAIRQTIAQSKAAAP